MEGSGSGDQRPALWISYGMLLWLAQEQVVLGKTGGEIRGFLFVPWAVTLGIVWLASIRQHWSIAMVALGATTMFVLLSVAYYADSSDLLEAGGWAGFATSGRAGYAALAEMVNLEFARPVLPTGPDFLDWWAEQRARTH